MSSPELKKNIIITLFILSLVLIVLHVAINKFYPLHKEELPVKEISAAEVNERFKKAVLNYGFDEAWIVSKKAAVEEGEIFKYQVNVPGDVPIALLLKEITNSYLPSEAEILVEEKKINGANQLRILSNGHLKLISDFSYVKEITRESGYAGTLIFDAENLNAEEMNSLLRIPELFGVVLIPSKSSALLSGKISESNKEIIVLLNDDIKELKFKLGSDFPEKRIKEVIRTIIGTYPRAAFYLIDANSSLYNSTAGEQIKGEFLKRNIRLLPTSMLLYFNSDTDQGLDRIIRTTGEEKRLIAVNADSYLKLNDEVERVRKIGFKFINPSTAVK